MHADQYLEAKEARLKAHAERKRAVHDVNGSAFSVNNAKRARVGDYGEERDADGRIKVNTAARMQQEEEDDKQRKRDAEEAFELQVKAVGILQESMKKATVNEYMYKYGKEAMNFFEEDQARIKASMEDEDQRQLLMPETMPRGSVEEDTRRMLGQNKWTGRFMDGTGRFEDDFDNRLPR